MTRPRRAPSRTRGPAATPLIPDPRPGEKEPPETREPYDLPFPDRWPPGRPEYVIVVDQLRGWQPGQSGPSPSFWKPGAPANQSQTWKPNHDRTPMPLTIPGDLITSDRATRIARLVPGRPPAWQVTWLPGQLLYRNTAITVMILADLTGEEDLHEGHRLWPHIQGLAAEPGLTGPEAIAAASQPPGDINRQQEQADGQPDREAAD